MIGFVIIMRISFLKMSRKRDMQHAASTKHRKKTNDTHHTHTHTNERERERERERRTRERERNANI